MVLSDPAKNGLESAWCIDWLIRFPEQRQNITIMNGNNIRVCHFFVQCIIAKNMWYCHLGRHLKYFQRWKTTTTCQSNFPNTTKSYQKIVTNCELDFRLNFALNGGHLGNHLLYVNLVKQACECFILIVSIIRPLNIYKKSKLKCFISSF